MRDYGKVHTSFWSSPTIQGMSDDARLLALYLMTSPHTTIVGVFRLPDGYASEDLGWAAERVAKGFEELLSKGFANRCETTKWVWITKHLVWNPPENPNQVKAAAKCAATIPIECAWKQAFMRLHGPLLGFGDEFEEKGCGTLSEPLLNQKQEQKQEQKQKKEKAPAAQVVGLEAIPQDLLEEWKGVRAAKRAGKITPTVVKALEREAAKAGLSVEAAIRKCVERGWQGFEADWLKDAKAKAADEVRTSAGVTPTTGALQRLAADRMTPEQFAASEAARHEFNAKRKGVTA